MKCSGNYFDCLIIANIELTIITSCQLKKISEYIKFDSPKTPYCCGVSLTSPSGPPDIDEARLALSLT